MYTNDDNRPRADLIDNLSDLVAGATDISTAFEALTRRLQDDFDITKGFLARREGDETRFQAIARFREGGTVKKLSLRLPNCPSLFEQVAEDGRGYSDNFAELFDGNHIERSLLIDEDTVSYMLRPLKCDGRVVGMLGYSSDRPHTFTLFEKGLFDSIFDRMGILIASTQEIPVAP